ncbi:unnamed protein product [Caretta caretta]
MRNHLRQRLSSDSQASCTGLRNLGGFDKIGILSIPVDELQYSRWNSFPPYHNLSLSSEALKERERKPCLGHALDRHGW